MGTWIKANGTEIELNDSPATEAKAKACGWQKKGDAEEAKAPEARKKNKAEQSRTHTSEPMRF